MRSFEPGLVKLVWNVVTGDPLATGSIPLHRSMVRLNADSPTMVKKLCSVDWD